MFTKIFSIELTGIPDLPGIPARYPPRIPTGYPVSNPLGVCPKKGGTAGIPAGIPVRYFQRGIKSKLTLND